jgi:hypothetical protein
VASELRRSSSARRPRLARGGPDGNSRLTATTAVALLVLLAAEGATVPFVQEQLTLHIFLGLVLIPPVLLKLASTGWRFARYYRGAVEYVAMGPPHPFMRFLVAPLVIASTMGLFGTGVLLVVMHPARGAVLDLHKASFLVWLGAMSAHVLGHVLNVPRLVRADFERGQPGARLRQLLIAGAIVAGLIVAIAALPAAHDWAHWVTSQHHDRHDG